MVVKYHQGEILRFLTPSSVPNLIEHSKLLSFGLFGSHFYVYKYLSYFMQLLLCFKRDLTLFQIVFIATT